jgi:YidC/Oxa1 family membrane protein insertase
MIRRLPRGRWATLLTLLALAALVAVVVSACGATFESPAATSPAAAASPAASGEPSPSPSASPLPPEAIPLQPAKPGANPIDLMAWLFTPIWQALFITLIAVDQLFNNIAISIIFLTLLLRLILIPIYRRQLVSQRRMQMLAPEIAEIRKRYKGDRLKQNEAVQKFYQERGVNPASGCLPLLLQFVLLIPMYSVISAGLTNTDPSAMLNVFGIQLIDLNCPPLEFYPDGKVVPCIDTVAFGVDWAYPQISFYVLGFGISALAILTALIQLVQSRMMLPPSDPSTDDANARIQRQTMLILPLISIVYGAFLPAGLLLYWLVSTVFSAIQQYLTIGWGSTFPIFGWTPAFAKDHTPRFPVSIPQPKPAKDGTVPPVSTPADRSAAAASTIRRRERGRQGRRGRRR